MFDKISLILASASPRRKQLLEQMGFSPILRPTHINETYPQELPARKVAAYLARKKAEAARQTGLEKQQIILAADSTVLLNNHIYEKPQNPQEAEQILRKLSGNTHHVITGVCLLSNNRMEVFDQTSQVSFAPFQDWEIQYYIKHYAPFDKAGSYGIQDWIGLCKVREIHGSYTNVMGLPTARTYEMIKKFIN